MPPIPDGPSGRRADLRASPARPPVVTGPNTADSERLEIEQRLGAVHDACREIGDSVLAAWVAAGGTSDPRELGRSCRVAIEPAAARAAAELALSPRLVMLLAIDRLHQDLQRWRRHHPGAVPDEAVDTFLHGAGDTRRQRRTLTTRPDAGPEVALPIPATCCVLRRSAHPDSCPTCPRLADDDERRRGTEQWLRSLGDHDFVAITGRERHPTAPPSG